MREILEHFHKKIESRIDDAQLFARVTYASILSSYERSNALGSRVGLRVPPLEPITEAVYESWGGRWTSKKGSFQTAEAISVSNGLNLTYKKPRGYSGNTIKFKLTFDIGLEILKKLERGDISWDNISSDKLLRLLWASYRTGGMSSGNSVILYRAIRDVQIGGKQSLLKHNPRPYFEIAVKNMLKEKTFINMLIR